MERNQEKSGAHEFRKGQMIELAIDDVTDMGQGIGRFEGLAVFTDGAMPGDVVRAELTKVKKNFANARVTEILEKSPERTDEKCGSAALGCGGCLYDGFSYEGQLRLKEKQVRDKLVRLAGIKEPRVAPIIRMERPYEYRNKAQMPICGEAVGFYRGRSHTVVDCEACRLQKPTVAAAAEAMRQYIRETGVKSYDAKSGKGLLRHLVVRTAAVGGEVMAVIVAAGGALPQAERLAELLDDAIYALPPQPDGTEYSLESIVINVNKDSGSKVLGDECIVLAGKPTILDEADGMSFEISPLAFYQVNPQQMIKLYHKVLEYAALEGEETVFDLYCGVGTIGLFCAREMAEKCRERYGDVDYDRLGCVYGIESVKGAVLDANRNAVINGIVNARYITGKAEEKIAELLAGKIDKSSAQDENAKPIRPDVVILDPPRSGCAAGLLEAVAKAAPDKIIYVSCDPGTLARDIKLLREGFGNGENSENDENASAVYELVEATPVDMFPWTGAVETVCLLRREG